MRITICDDDKLITFRLTEYLNEFFQNSRIWNAGGNYL